MRKKFDGVYLLDTGSALDRWLQREAGLGFIPHHAPLRTLPENAKYAFAINDPIERYLDIFEQRKAASWGNDEARAFALFPDAEVLAAALFDNDQAMFALRAIKGLEMDIAEYFRGFGFFMDDRPPVAILSPETLVNLSRKAPPKSPDRDALSAKAKANLERFYARDIALMKAFAKRASEAPANG